MKIRRGQEVPVLGDGSKYRDGEFPERGQGWDVKV